MLETMTANEYAKRLIELWANDGHYLHHYLFKAEWERNK